MNLEQIPNEILVKILSHVNQPSKMAELQLQSKGFQELVEKHYFERITGMIITPQVTLSDRISIQLHCPLFTEKVECELTRFGDVFEYFWRKSSNISQLSFKAIPMERSPFSTAPHKKTYNTMLLEIMRIVTEQRTCTRYPRNISQFDCIPCITLPPVGLDTYTTLFSYCKNMISNWKYTLKTTIMGVAPEKQAEWVDIMKETTIQKLNLYFPTAYSVPVESNIMTHPTLTPAPVPEQPQGTPTNISFTTILQGLKPLLHQPNRIIQQLDICVSETTVDITPQSAAALHALLIGLHPVKEFSLEIPFTMRNRWHQLLKQRSNHTPSTPFCEKLEILHVGSRLGLMCENFVSWPLWNLFPNLQQITGTHLTYTFIDNLAQPLNNLSGCKQFKNRQLTFQFRPIPQNNNALLGRFLKQSSNYQLNIPPGLQYTWQPQPHSSCQTLHITMSCSPCPPSSKHQCFLIIPTRIKGPIVPSQLFASLL